jgi:hypothetical protein
MRHLWRFSRQTLWPATWPGRALIAIAGWGAAIILIIQVQAAHAASAVTHRPVQVPGTGYATSVACRSCHPGNYASWHASFHRTMTQVANAASVIPALDGMKLSLEGWDYRVELQGSTYFVKRRPAHSPDKPYAESREIVLLTGSHNLQFLWTETGKGRTLEHFPFGWLVAEKMWVSVTDTFLCPPEFHAGDVIGDWNSGCIDCHTTQGRTRPVKDSTFDSQVTEFGVSCEACHSEGRDHVEKNHNPLRRYQLHLTGKSDPTIANAAKLNGPASALICGQCHSVWAFSNTAHEAAWRRDGVKFRPGQPALPERFVIEPAKDDHRVEKEALRKANPTMFDGVFWADGKVRIVGREYNGIAASPCFKGGEFSCVTCHEMHPPETDAASLRTWSVNQLKPAAESDAVCLSCHEPIKAKLTEHTHHAATSAGSHCYDCHLPHTSFGLLRAVRSHEITVPTVKESQSVGRPNACNLCHLDQPLAWTAEKLHAWYGQPIPELSRDDREIAASVRWLLRGDAGQRALVAWSMGWAPAQQASGRDWLPPYLIGELVDPYSAVRFVAWKSLQTLPGFKNLAYNYSDGRSALVKVASKTQQRWLQLQRGQIRPDRRLVLLNADGSFELGDYERLLFLRDNRPVFIIE